MTLLVAIFAALALFAGSALYLLVLVRRNSPTETRLAALQSQTRAAYDSEAPDKAQVHDALGLLTSPTPRLSAIGCARMIKNCPIVWPLPAIANRKTPIPF